MGHISKILMSALGIYTVCFAPTEVYFTNNTPFQLSLSYNQSGDQLDASRWEHGSNEIGPFDRAKLYQFARDLGVTNKKIYLFNTNITIDTNPLIHLIIRQAVQGKIIGSDIRYTANIPKEKKLEKASVPEFLKNLQEISSQSMGWQEGRNNHLFEFSHAGYNFVLNAKSTYTGKFDNIEYSLSLKIPEPKQATSSQELNLFFYNTFLLHGKPGAFARAGMIPQYISPNYDVCIFAELFEQVTIDKLLKSPINPHNMKQKGYKYITKENFKAGRLAGSGLFIVSRWPIEKEKHHVFENCFDQKEWESLSEKLKSSLDKNKCCTSDDCLASKGIIYAQINKLGKKYHIFATHLQALTDPQAELVRYKQLQQFRGFIDKQNIPKNEPVILAGDFNINYSDQRGSEYSRMITILDALYPTSKGWPYSVDPSNGFKDPANAKIRIDFIFADKKHLLPIESFNEILLFKAYSPWQTTIFDKISRANYELSDHYPVYGYFKFK